MNIIVLFGIINLSSKKVCLKFDKLIRDKYNIIIVIHKGKVTHMSNNKASLPVIRRLPRYYRYLSELNANGVKHISSSQLAKILGSTSSQVRQDFNCFGGFGQQGVGYSTELLLEQIEKLLFPENMLRAVLVGVDNMGLPVAQFIRREHTAIELIGLFDTEDEKVGEEHLGITVKPIEDLESFCKENNVDIIVVCTGREKAKAISEHIINSGVKGIWNYSHFNFSVLDSSLIVENVHLRDNLMSLSYRVLHRGE